VAPALRAGEGHPLVRAALALIERDRPRRRQHGFAGLAEVARTFDPLLLDSPLGRGFAAGGAGDEAWGYEELAELFERLVAAAAISGYAVMGLSFAACRQLLPPELGLGPADALVEALDNRCRYWAHGSGGYGEGVSGWLDPAETAQLLAALAPRFGPGARPDGPLRDYCAEAGADETWHRGRIELFLAALRAAVTRGAGALWGRDLRLFYEPASCAFPGAPPPANLAPRP
ncbi:MAG TPA: hypothetical protein VGE07_20485, partial [Herpetosiphonaceae bacterium]